MDKKIKNNSMFGDQTEFVSGFVRDVSVTVPSGLSIMRALQYLEYPLKMEKVCWNGDCLDCTVEYLLPGGKKRRGLACLVNFSEGLTLVTLPTACSTPSN